MQLGTSRELFEMWAPDPRNGLIVTGYSIEGTLAFVSRRRHILYLYLSALFEIIFTRTKPPTILHLGILSLILSVYLGLAYSTKVAQDFYVYEWLDPQFGAGEIVAHVFAYTGIILSVFGFVWV